MSEKLPKNAFWRRTALALFIVSSSLSAVRAQSALQSEHAVMAVPDKHVSNIPAVPVAPQRQQSSQPSQDNSGTAADGRDTAASKCLAQLAFVDWSGQPLLYRRFESNRQTVVPGQAVSGQTLGASTGEPANLDLAKEFGLTAYSQRSFSRYQDQVIASIYQFATSEGAYGAYCCLRKGASNLIAKGDASSEDDKAISFWKDRYFVSISGNPSDDEESKVLVSKIAGPLAASIATSSSRPRILNQLPTLERVLGSERIVMGPLALKRLFPAPFVATLGTATLHGAIADYQVQEPYRERLKLLVLQFANPGSCSSTYTRYVAQLEEQHDLQDIGGLSYQTNVYKVGNTYMLCQMRGDEMVVITGGRKKLSLPSFAREIY
jgi:hypothetical protein